MQREGIVARLRWDRKFVGPLFSIFLVVAIAVGASLVLSGSELSSALVLREWAARYGIWFIPLFFCAYSLVSAVPIPRTIFTWAASVLFPPPLAIALALAGSAVGAEIAFRSVRTLFPTLREKIAAMPACSSITEHISVRGWPAVLSCRLVPIVPYSVLSYGAALSPIQQRHFSLASAIGSAPGTTSAILLGNSVVTGGSTNTLVFSISFAIVGIIGLIVDALVPVNQSDQLVADEID